jgi:hypothetical protein
MKLLLLLILCIDLSLSEYWHPTSRWTKWSKEINFEIGMVITGENTDDISIDRYVKYYHNDSIKKKTLIFEVKGFKDVSDENVMNVFPILEGGKILIPLIYLNKVNDRITMVKIIVTPQMNEQIEKSLIEDSEVQISQEVIVIKQVSIEYYNPSLNENFTLIIPFSSQANDDSISRLLNLWKLNSLEEKQMYCTLFWKQYRFALCPLLQDEQKQLFLNDISNKLGQDYIFDRQCFGLDDVGGIVEIQRVLLNFTPFNNELFNYIAIASKDEKKEVSGEKYKEAVSVPIEDDKEAQSRISNKYKDSFSGPGDKNKECTGEEYKKGFYGFIYAIRPLINYELIPSDQVKRRGSLTISKEELDKRIMRRSLLNIRMTGSNGKLNGSAGGEGTCRLNRGTRKSKKKSGVNLDPSKIINKKLL